MKITTKRGCSYDTNHTNDYRVNSSYRIHTFPVLIGLPPKQTHLAKVGFYFQIITTSGHPLNG